MRPRDYFEQRVQRGPSCWEWTGAKNPKGYGYMPAFGRGHYLAHRMSYELFVGPIPEGLELDHLCRNRGCVNPDHVEPVTHLENMRRGAFATRTLCVNGHHYDAVNTYIRPNGNRDCRVCVRERGRRYRARRAA